MRPSSTLLGGFAALLALAGFATPDPAAGRGRGTGVPAADPPTTVRVFVVWGASNACGKGGNTALSPNPNPDPSDPIAYEFYWRDDPAYPPVPLLDPFPCHGLRLARDKGSAWPQFAYTYNALPLGTPRDILFMSSAAFGGVTVTPADTGRVVLTADAPDWNPGSEGELYDDGLTAIENAMGEARAMFTVADGYAVSFGGVLWTQGNDLNREEQITPAQYKAALGQLLTAFGEDVRAGTGDDALDPDHPSYADARFYFINTPWVLYDDYGPTDVEFYLDLEADVCAGYAFCSMTQASGEIHQEYIDCGTNTACQVLWYTDKDEDPTNGYEPDPIHWGQEGLNLIGAAAADTVLAHDEVLATEEDPFRWEVAVEVPQPYEYADPDNPPAIRLKVYDSDGTSLTPTPDGLLVAPSIASPDWTADFDDDDPGADWPLGNEGWGDLATEFLTFEFWREAGTTATLLGRYVYVPTAIATGADGFYGPQPTTGPSAVRFEVTAAGAVRAGPGPGVGPLDRRLGPLYETALGEAPYVVPYNLPGPYATACGAACAEEPPAYFLARLPDDEGPPTATTQRYTFASTGDAVLPAAWGPLVWDVEDLVLEFPAGRRLRVQGDLTVERVLPADGVRFTEADPVTGSGWGGLRVEWADRARPAPTATLSGVTVERVVGPANVAGDAAVEVLGGADVTITDQSFIEGGQNVHGVWASGAGTAVTLDDESVVQDMAGSGTLGGIGVVAANGAVVRVYGSNTTIRENGAAGVAATGSGSEVYLYQASVQRNTGYGVASEQEGAVRFRQEGVTTIVAGVEVSDSGLGGLYARLDGDIRAGLHNGTTCTSGCQNRFPDNYNNVPSGFDAKAEGAGSTVYARFNDWDGDVRDAEVEGDLVLVEAPGPPDEVQVAPLWDGVALRPGGSGGAAMALALAGGPLAGSLGADSTAVGDPSAVGALVDEAYTAMETDDAAGAGAALLAALPLAATPDEVGLAFGTAARFVAHAADPALEGYLATRTTLTDPARPWALAALLAADAAAGRTEAAWAGAGTLASEYAGSDHAVAGLAMTARLAGEADDLAAAEGALAALQAGWPDLLATEAAGALVRWLHEGAAEDSLAAVADGQAGALIGGVEEAASQGEGVAPSVFRLLGARPNPFAHTTVVPFEVAEPSRVRLTVYDVLGREVARLADGPYEPGRYEAVLDGHALAAGLYLVRARVEPEAGAGRSYARPITLVR